MSASYRYLPHAANLQPWREVRCKAAARRLAFGLILGLCVAVGCHLYVQFSFAPRHEQLALQVKRLETQLEQSRSQQQQLSNSRIDFSTLVNAQRLYLSVLLLQQTLPARVRINSLELNEELVIEGSTYDKDTLVGLIDALTSESLVHQATLRQVSENSGEWDFTLNLALDEEQVFAHFYGGCGATDCIRSKG